MSTNTFPRMHVSLYVSDIANTVSFYTSFFGQEPVKVKPGYAKYVLEQPSLIISFVENKERVQQNFGHLGFQVETVAQLHSQLNIAKENHLTVREEMGTNCCFALQDKFWVNDPDGVQWEVYYFHEDAEFNDPHYETTDASACCITPASSQAEAPAFVQLHDITFADDSTLKPAKTKKALIELAELAAESEACCTPGSGCC